jgi:hypothetical protein
MQLWHFLGSPSPILETLLYFEKSLIPAREFNFSIVVSFEVEAETSWVLLQNRCIHQNTMEISKALMATFKLGAPVLDNPEPRLGIMINCSKDPNICWPTIFYRTVAVETTGAAFGQTNLVFGKGSST